MLAASTIAQPGVAARLLAVRERIARAAEDAGREPRSVSLVAVSKLFPTEAIAPALIAGHRIFGENYVQEARAKWVALRDVWPDIELHLIGPLQSNKARDAVALFDVLQTLDRESLAKALAKEIQRAGKSPRLFIQVNTGDETQKGGVAVADIEVFLKLCRGSYDLSPEGMMCIPPVADPPSPHFALLRRIARDQGLPLLSMGMSADFEQAITLGATHVRIGTAIFGERDKD